MTGTHERLIAAIRDVADAAGEYYFHEAPACAGDIVTVSGYRCNINTIRFRHYRWELEDGSEDGQDETLMDEVVEVHMGDVPVFHACASVNPETGGDELPRAVPGDFTCEVHARGRWEFYLLAAHLAVCGRFRPKNAQS